jgi:ribosomal protein L11 methyltransferase
MSADEEGRGRGTVIHQVILETDAATAPRILKAFEEAAEPLASAVGLFNLGADLLNPGANMFDPGADRFEVFAHYASPPPRDELLRLIEAASAGDKIGPLRIEAIGPADWVTLSQGQRGPVTAGRFFVHGSHDRGRAPRHHYVVEIDAGQVFGTAHHASTRGCLVALDDLCKRTRPRCILDLGTGSGILAIAAAKALKQRVLASDSDKLAVATAADNARINCALPSIGVIHADGLAHPELPGSSPTWSSPICLPARSTTSRPLWRAASPRAAPPSCRASPRTRRGIEARLRSPWLRPEKANPFDGWTTLVLGRRNTRPAR